MIEKLNGITALKQNASRVTFDCDECDFKSEKSNIMQAT